MVLAMFTPGGGRLLTVLTICKFTNALTSIVSAFAPPVRGVRRGSKSDDGLPKTLKQGKFWQMR